VTGACTRAAEPGGRLSIDLAAIRANYARIAASVAPARLAAVVKADAYGLGAARIAPALAEAGCRAFFVATFEEALRLQSHLPDEVSLHVLNGLAPGDEPLCALRGVRPVLNSREQALRWMEVARRAGRVLPAALQVDTGMSRLGLAPGEAVALLADADFVRAVDVTLLMTHLACADAPDAPANVAQLDRLHAVAAASGRAIPLSISASAGAALPAGFHGDLVRAGLALFGAAAAPGLKGRLSPVVRLQARVIQVRQVEAGTGVGYGLTYTAPSTRRLATLGVGYADGWPRRLGGLAAAWRDGVRLPIVGRISMDTMTIDVTDLPPGAQREGDYVDLIGPDVSVETVAEQAETIPYEILAALGARLRRDHIEAPTHQEVAA